MIVVLGGTRSGKSRFGASVAARSGAPVTVVATAVAVDEEMRNRIESHRRSRLAAWTVIEEPLGIADAVPDGSATVLLDGVDVWLANRLEARGGATARPWNHGQVVDEALEEIGRLQSRASLLIVVSAEVGMSLLPLTPYGRAFTDLLGELNQRLVAQAAEAYLMVAGVPLTLKPRPHP